MRRTKDPGQDPHWQDIMLPTSWEHLRPIPTRGTSSDKSPPRTTTSRLARQVSASHDKSPRHRSSPRLRLGCGPRHMVRTDLQTPTPRRVGDWFPAPCNCTSWQPTQVASPNKTHNAGLLSCAAIPSPSPPTLSHASFARDTQASPTTSSSLRLGLNMVG
jgi:hypothetical protein